MKFKLQPQYKMNNDFIKEQLASPFSFPGWYFTIMDRMTQFKIYSMVFFKDRYVINWFVHDASEVIWVDEYVK